MLGLRLRERCLRGVVRHRVLCGVGKTAWVRVWGVWFVSGACYLHIFVFAGNGCGFP